MLSVIKRFPEGTVASFAKEADVSERMIKKYLKELRDLNIIRRVGSNRKGYWEIIGTTANESHESKEKGDTNKESDDE